MEWRRRTVIAAQSLRIKSNGVADRTARKLQDMLEPALTQNPRMSLAKTDQLTRELQTLCNKALELSLVLRSNKSILKFIVQERDTKFIVEETEMELVAMTGRMFSTVAQVEFTVFGGLEKTTLFPGDNEETVKLEKEQIIGRACETLVR